MLDCSSNESLKQLLLITQSYKEKNTPIFWICSKESKSGKFKSRQKEESMTKIHFSSKKQKAKASALFDEPLISSLEQEHNSKSNLFVSEGFWRFERISFDIWGVV